MESTVGGRPGRLGLAGVRMPLFHQVTMPAKDSVRSDEQPQSSQHLPAQWLKEGCKKGPVIRREPHLLGAESPLEDSDLVAQRQDLRILGAVAHRQQTKRGKRVGDGKVSETKQHD
jgi:hypothetical protein